jgi:dienelactone hydrolase
VTEEQPVRHYVGEILGTQPAVKRVSRRVAFRGYRVFVCAEIDENGKPTKQTEFFKPTVQYDRGVLSANRYTPHQGKRECARRLKQITGENQ